MFDLGINASFIYNDGYYAWFGDLQPTIDKLNWLGVKLIRVAAPNPGNQMQHGYAALAAQGFRFSLHTAMTPAAQLAEIKAKCPKGSVYQIEGPNEPNNWPGGGFGQVEATAYMTALTDGMRADPWFEGVKTAGIVSYPVLSSPGATFANLHVYPPADQHPRAEIEKAMRDQGAVEPGRRFTLTEIGYRDPPTDRIVEALDFAKADPRIDSLFIYELLDDRAGKTEGLFRMGEGSPEQLAKPAAHAVKAWVAAQQVTVPTSPPPTTLPVEEIRARLVKARTEANDTKNRAARSVYAIDKAIEALPQ